MTRGRDFITREAEINTFEIKKMVPGELKVGCVPFPLVQHAGDIPSKKFLVVFNER